jgi:excisionase family DNA binding protein
MKYLTTSQAATYLHVSIKTIRRWESSGRLHAERTLRNHRQFTIETLVSLQSKTTSLSTAKTPTFFTISQAAQYLQLSVKTIRRWEKAGRIQAVRNNHNQRVFTLQSLKHAQAIQSQHRQLPLFYRTYNHLTTLYRQVQPALLALILLIAASSMFDRLNYLLIHNSTASSPAFMLTSPVTTNPNHINIINHSIEIESPPTNNINKITSNYIGNNVVHSHSVDLLTFTRNVSPDVQKDLQLNSVSLNSQTQGSISPSILNPHVILDNQGNLNIH